jgi:oxygen-independent coproporphyrinogen III oxidase
VMDAPAPILVERNFERFGLPRHLYVHVPFCRRRCSYCDFSIAVRRATPTEEYLAAIAKELSHVGTAAWELDTLYLGGGTPSQLRGNGIARLVDLVRAKAILAPRAEVTIEANPEDVSVQAAGQWAATGVNRVSLGIQTFSDKALAWMHRSHTVDTVAGAFETLRAAGIQNISLDLIFALPPHLERSWEADLERAIDLRPSHISLYGLTIEPHTPLGHWQARGEAVEGSEDTYAEEFLLAHERLISAGFAHYEVSNYGRPDLHSRHNQAYWLGSAYLGIGPAAHSYDGGHRWWNVSAYNEWHHRLMKGDEVVAGAEQLAESDRLAEQIYLGLRTTHGLDLSSDEEKTLVARWIEAGWGSMVGERLVLTALGWLRLDSIAAALTLERSRS